VTECVLAVTFLQQTVKLLGKSLMSLRERSACRSYVCECVCPWNKKPSGFVCLRVRVCVCGRVSHVSCRYLHGYTPRIFLSLFNTDGRLHCILFISPEYSGCFDNQCSQRRHCDDMFCLYVFDIASCSVSFTVEFAVD